MATIPATRYAKSGDVHIASASLAGAGEVPVSGTVKDLVAGSGITFEDRGVKALEGIPGDVHMYAVASA